MDLLQYSQPYKKYNSWLVDISNLDGVLVKTKEFKVEKNAKDFVKKQILKQHKGGAIPAEVIEQDDLPALNRKEIIVEIKAKKHRPRKNAKFSESQIMDFLDGMLIWALQPGNIMITHYWLDPNTDHSIQYNTLARVWEGLPTAKDYYDYINEILAEKIAYAALKNDANANFAKYLLGIKYKGWREKIEQNINVNQNVISWQWDNPELNGTNQKSIECDDENI